MVDKTEKNLPTQQKNFYTDLLKELVDTTLPFLVGGTFAFSEYTKIVRPTKDIDLFCKAGDYPRILQVLTKRGFTSEITDERWIVKAVYNDHFADIIFGTKSGICQVDDTWFEGAPTATILGSKVKLIPPVELIWSKAYRMERNYYDGADVNHMILACGKKLDWKHLLNRMEQNWEILFSHLLNFRFVYPSERNIVPKWLMDELISRLNHQLELPSANDKVCRGYMLSYQQYKVDIEERGYKSIT